MKIFFFFFFQNTFRCSAICSSCVAVIRWKWCAPWQRRIMLLACEIELASVCLTLHPENELQRRTTGFCESTRTGTNGFALAERRVSALFPPYHTGILLTIKTSLLIGLRRIVTYIPQKLTRVSWVGQLIYTLRLITSRSFILHTELLNTFSHFLTEVWNFVHTLVPNRPMYKILV